jgi:flagellum-specific ATP synthase
MSLLADAMAMVDAAATVELHGSVVQVRGLAVRVQDLPAPVGASVRILSDRGRRVMPGEVVGFEQDQTIIMPLGTTDGIRSGDTVIVDQFQRVTQVGDGLLGRVLDGMGRPIDGKGRLHETSLRTLDPQPLDALDRPLIEEPLAVGIRAIDGLHTVGRGQRLGIFAAPGLGKSTLLGQIARHTDADVSVIAMIGERGREVRDFVVNSLGDAGMERSVVVCATSDEPPLLRIRAALVACTVAEYFRDRGGHVLLMMDSVTRFCQAQRQVGLAAGEPPATKGFPPSVFTTLPRLLERSGCTTQGSITGLFAVLVEGDELTDPVADAARGVLDGHIQLSQRYANRGHWPAIDPVTSISRVADAVTPSDQQSAARTVKQLVSAYQEAEDLINIGAYAPGSNPDIDLAIACKPAIDAFLQQGRHEGTGRADLNHTRQLLHALMHAIQQHKLRLARPQQQRRATPPPAAARR